MLELQVTGLEGTPAQAFAELSHEGGQQVNSSPVDLLPEDKSPAAPTTGAEQPAKTTLNKVPEVKCSQLAAKLLYNPSSLAADVVACFPVAFTQPLQGAEQRATFLLVMQGRAAVAALTTPLHDKSDTAPPDQSKAETLPDCQELVSPSLTDIPVRQQDAWLTPSQTSSPLVRRSLPVPLFRELHHLDDLCTLPSRDHLLLCRRTGKQSILHLRA